MSEKSAFPPVDPAGPDAEERLICSDLRTTFDLDAYLCAALRADASGFLLKDGGPGASAGVRARGGPASRMWCSCEDGG